LRLFVAAICVVILLFICAIRVRSCYSSVRQKFQGSRYKGETES
jgi:hypothetical protein